MKKSRLTALLAGMTIAGTCSFGVNAQSDLSTDLVEAQRDSLIKSHRIIIIPGGNQGSVSLDSLEAKIGKFYYDQFRSFQDPASPYFMFMSRDGSLGMGIGGCVRMRGWYDWGGAIPSNGFAPAMIPMDPSPTEMRQLGTTPAGSSLFFRVLGNNRKLTYQLYIEANFNGYGARDFHLKKAYAILNDWTVGYASSTFSDPAAEAPTVDAQGPNNKLGVTDVLVRWMKDYKKFTVAASVETPAEQADNTGTNTAKCNEWLPDVAAFVQYSWKTGQHLRVAGIVRTLSYRDLIKATNHNVAGGGIMVSGVGRPIGPLTIYGIFTAGKGISSLGGDLAIGNYDLVPDPDKPGTLYAPCSIGWNAALQWNFRPNLFVSATVGESRYLPEYTEAGTNYKYGIYCAANIFWNLTPRIQVGAEFNYGQRHNFNGDWRHAQRLEAMCQFSF